MRRLPVLLLTLSLLLASAAHADRRPRRDRRHPPPATSVVIPQEPFEMRLDAAIEQLARLSGLTESRIDEVNRRRLQTELEQLRNELQALRVMVRGAPLAEFVLPPIMPAIMPVVVEVEEIVPPSPMPMHPEAFQQALASLETHTFSDARLDALREIARHNLFLVDQVVAVLSSFTFGSDQLKALEILAPRIVDPETGFRILEAFTFDSEKKRASQILNSVR